MNHQFKVGDVVESEWFSDIGEVTEVAGNSVKVRNTWFLAKNVHLSFKPLSEKPKTEGRKDDQQKPDLSLLPREALETMAYAFMHGEKKYGRYNYLGGMDWHRPLSAALRHITAYNSGENLDVESGISHLGHALAAIAMLVVYQTKGLGTDTRYKR